MTSRGRHAERQGRRGRLGKSRLFVVGYTIDQDSSPDADFVIRAYDIRGDAPDPH
jgi:hypothetical protein